MKNEVTNTEVKKMIKINKLKISKLFYEMNPLRDPKERLKIAEELFLNNCVQNNLSQREKNAFSERKKLPKLNLQNIKNVYNFSNRNNQINKNNNITKSLSEKFLITSLKIPKNSIKYLKNKNNFNKNKNNKDFHKNYSQYKKVIIHKNCMNKNELDFNKFKGKDFENEILKDTLNKQKTSFNMLNNYYSYENSLDENNITPRNNIKYDIKKYYRSNMILPKITKQFIKPLFENNKSKEIKDIFSLKQYQIKEIEEKLKLKPFIY